MKKKMINIISNYNKTKSDNNLFTGNQEGSIWIKMNSITDSNTSDDPELSKLSENSSEKTKIETDLKNLLLKYGNYKILSYDKNGDPLFVIGPDTKYFYFLLILNIIILMTINLIIWSFVNFTFYMFGVFLETAEVSFFILCSIINPGLPKKEYQLNVLLNKNSGFYKRCKECGFIVDMSKEYRHCFICECCCEGMDHHCQWITKCIGKGNILYFNLLVFAIFLLFGYLIFIVILISSGQNNNKNK